MLTVENIIKLPVTELKIGDEYWGDIIPDDTGELEIIGTSMCYRLEDGPQPSTDRRDWIVWLVRWDDGGSSHRQWTRNRRLTVRRAS